MVEGVLLALIDEVGGLGSAFLFEAEALEANGGGHAGFEVLLHVDEVNTIMRTLGAGERALH